MARPLSHVCRRGTCDIGDDLNTDGSGSPTLGDTIENVMGIADPFLASPDGDYFHWSRTSDETPIQRLGRPYLAFDLSDQNNARIVGLGPNRRYDLGFGDDVVFYLFR